MIILSLPLCMSGCLFVVRVGKKELLGACQARRYGLALLQVIGYWRSGGSSMYFFYLVYSHAPPGAAAYFLPT